MRLRTSGQLFDHNCQLKDMKLSGFNPSSLRYHCTICGGVFLLKLDRDKWEEAFGENPSFRLSKKILQVLDQVGASAIEDDDEIEKESSNMEKPDEQKFTWEPTDEDEEE